MVLKWDVTIPPLSGDQPRRAYVCLPESYEEDEEKRYPVMYMFDGHNVFFDEDATYGKSWGMARYMEESRKELIIVAVECNHSGNRRLVEYAPFTYENSEHGRIRGKGSVMLHWMVKTLKPYIDETYRTLPDRKNTIIAGSSMGGLIALYGATAYNHVFQRGACLSPSLWVAPGKVLEMIARAHIRRDTQIYMDYGENEMFNHAATSESIISTAHLLLTKRVNLAFRIVPGGTHSEASWWYSRLLLWRAVKYMDNHCDPEPLLELCSTVCRQNPSNMIFHVYQGYALSLLGRHQEAIQVPEHVAEPRKLVKNASALLIWSAALPSGDPRQEWVAEKLTALKPKMRAKQRALVDRVMNQRRSFALMQAAPPQLEPLLQQDLERAESLREKVGAHMALAVYCYQREKWQQAQMHLEFVLDNANKLHVRTQAEELLCKLPSAFL